MANPAPAVHVGETYGRLSILREVERDERPRSPAGRYFEARCSCGTVVVVLGKRLRRGTTRSCGCLRRELLQQNRGHGRYAPKGATS